MFNIPGKTAAIRSYPFVILAFGFLATSGSREIEEPVMRAVRLRCEFRNDPLAVAAARPTLTWTPVSRRRGARQTAWQIVAASSPEAAVPERADLWDSGRVSSEENCAVYRGTRLAPGERVFWRVRVWDERGVVSPWSEPAWWQWGPVWPEQWHARWIGRPSLHPPRWEDFTLEIDAAVDAGAAGIVFRAQDSDNLYMWQINMAGPVPMLRPHIRKNGAWFILEDVPLAAVLNDHTNGRWFHVRITATGACIETWIDGRRVDRRRDETFAAGTIGFRGAKGEQARFRNIRVTAPDGTVLLDVRSPQGQGSGDFPSAPARGDAYEQPQGVLLYRPAAPRDSLLLRNEFDVPGVVKRATAYVCGLGWYELWLNGAKASDGVLTPANTRYQRRCLYDAWDVTAYLHPGRNAIGLWLGNGYNSDYSRWGWRWENTKRAVCELVMDLEDGRRLIAGSGPNWRMAPGPITYCSIYHGEIYDAGREQRGWAEAGFDDHAWEPVAVVEPPGPVLNPCPAPPCRVTETLKPVRWRPLDNGVWVFDLGQNFAGWPRIRVRGPRGTRISMKTSELVDDAGRLHPCTNRAARSTDVYILEGAPDGEEYEPRFTYHGFRYVEVRGLPAPPSIETLDGRVVHADVPFIGTFECSDPLIQRIHRNCVWSLRSNLMSIPTDCPMRDERTPCQMDSQTAEEAALFNFDMQAYYRKWLGDIAGGKGNPDWNGDQVVLAWRLYRFYGDRRIIEEMFPAMKQYVDFLAARAPEGVWRKGFGDWCAPNRGTWESFFREPEVVNTCLFHECARIVAESARVLGNEDAAAHYSKLAERVRSALNRELWHPDTHTYGGGAQPALILPLALGLVPEERRQAVFDALVRRITMVDRNHLDTGIFGTRYLVDVLADGGRMDLAWTILCQETYPGFGFQIRQGATTAWEQWTARGNMNSHNHAMFAGIDASFYTRIAGIRLAAPGWRRIVFHPVPPPGLKHAGARVRTVRGEVACNWRREGNTFAMDVEVPVGAAAEVWLPTAAANAVTESGNPVSETEHVRFLRSSQGCTVFEVDAGRYAFRTACVDQ